MKVFLDTSSLFKLYHEEEDSDIIESIFRNNKVNEVFLSELSKIELASTVWKKVRIGDIQEAQAKVIIDAFEEDFSKYTFIQIDNIIVEVARSLINKYGKKGLRALDSIQLSTAVMLTKKVDLFASADKLLASLLKWSYCRPTSLTHNIYN